LEDEIEDDAEVECFEDEVNNTPSPLVFCASDVSPPLLRRHTVADDGRTVSLKVGSVVENSSNVRRSSLSEHPSCSFNVLTASPITLNRSRTIGEGF